MDKPHSISISTGTFLKAVLVGLALAFLWFVREIAALLFVSVLLAALIDPFADWFAKRHVPRGVAVVLVYLVLGGLLTTAIIVLIPVVIDQLSQFVASAPTSPLIGYLGRFQAVTAHYGLQDNVHAALQSLQEGVSGSFTSIFSTISGFVRAWAALFIVLVLTFYLVVEDGAARRSFKNLAPEEYQPYLSQMLLKMQKKVGAWLRGQLLLGVIVGIAVYVGLLVLDVRYALLLACIAGLFELLPYVGPVLSVVPAAIIALGQSPLKALSVLVLYFVIQQLENHILVPKIMQKVTGLNPVVSIVALLIGVKLGGFIGAFLSIPIATMAMVILEAFFDKHSTHETV